MIPPAWCVLAETASHTYFRFARLQAMSEWWHWLGLAALCVALLVYVVIMYWADAVELSRGVAWTLVLLRVAAFAGILFFFLDLEKRTQDRDIKHSRAILLVDTSQSMGLRDADPASATGGATRMETVLNELRRGDLFEQLRARHDVVVYRFDQQTQPSQVAFFQRTSAAGDRTQVADQVLARKQNALNLARLTAAVSATLGGLALLSLIVYLLFGRGPTRQSLSWALLVSMVALVAAAVVFAVAQLRSPDLSVRAIVGLEEPNFADALRAELARQQPEPGESRDEQTSQQPADIAWQEELVPQGTETRIGDTLRAVIDQERGGPLAGLILITDGGNNAGIDCQIPLSIAEAANIPLYAVGLGSDRQPINARVVDLEAPKRVFPGDNFTVTGYLQAYGMEGRLLDVELDSLPAGTEPGASDGTGAPDEMPAALFEDERSVRVPGDGQIVTLKFEVTPAEAGTRNYRLRVKAPQQDIEPRDNLKLARVQVVERKTRVLLVAGGPTREYRFLRNMLYRDNEVTVHVWLQSGEPGISQEADDVLFEFPQLAAELFEYDCIVAFDPDWTLLDATQVELLDRWVAEQAGGMIVVAGPVYTPEWTSVRRGRDPQLDVVKGLYPVVFYSQGSPNMSLGKFGGEAAWPLQFSRDGLGAEFLWLEDDPIDSEAAWSTFEGVYGYYAVKDPKPGARIYAHFSNPETSIDGELPIYMAGHFYGAGRVFFQASGEVWRLRAVEERYFETYYTKLIRWASQGRLLRDSSRGVLLVDKDRCLLGDRVTVRAVLNDPQHRPLTLSEVPAILIPPEGQRNPIVLKKVQDASREGMFETQFVAVQEGDYRIEVTPPGSTEGELLSTDVRVRVPALETERPQRNDTLLKELANTTDGQYYIGFGPAMGRSGATRASLPQAVQQNDQIVYLPESLDTNFERQLMGWLIGLIAGVLSLEWLIRRLNKLA